MRAVSAWNLEKPPNYLGVGLSDEGDETIGIYRVVIIMGMQHVIGAS